MITGSGFTVYYWYMIILSGLFFVPAFE